MNISNILQLVIIAGCAVCVGLALSAAIMFEIEAKKLRDEIESELKKREESGCGK